MPSALSKTLGVRNFPEIKKIDDYKSDELVQIFIGLTIKIAELIISNIYFYLLLYEVKFPAVQL